VSQLFVDTGFTALHAAVGTAEKALDEASNVFNAFTYLNNFIYLI
jgi:hypothetical protein